MGFSTGAIVGFVLLILALLIGWAIILWYVSGYVAWKLRASRALIFFILLVFPFIGLPLAIFSLFMPAPPMYHYHVHGDPFDVKKDVHDDFKSHQLEEFVREEQEIKEKEEQKEKQKEEKKQKKTGSPKKKSKPKKVKPSDEANPLVV
jgi:hypothetical protein